MSRPGTGKIDHKLLDDLRGKLEAVKENDWNYIFLRDILAAIKYGDIEGISFAERRKLEFLHRKYCQ